MTMLERKKPVWEPQQPNETNVWKFINYVNAKHQLSIRTYNDLHQWSVNPTTLYDFWRDAYAWLELAPSGSMGVTPARNKRTDSRPVMFPPEPFFPSEKLSLAEIIFRNRPDDDVAIFFASQSMTGVEQFTWRDLRERTRKIRSSLRASGVGVGDVVAAVISNSVDAITIALATLSLGAVWSSTSCDLGAVGTLDRYCQISPKIIFADNGYTYAKETISLQERIETWSVGFKDLQNELSNVVVIPNCSLQSDVSRIYRGCTFEEFLSRGSGEALEFDLMPFSHPAFILFSSGTTGKPKCIVHSTGGVGLKVKTDMSLQHDIRKSDVVFQYTTTSWVMWVLNFVNLSCAKAMLLYDGSPFHPGPTKLLDLAHQVGVSVFGTSPRYLSHLKSLEIVPRESFDMSKLRVVTSTGSELPTDLYNWFYETAFPPAAHLISMSGGTDIAGCFVGGTPLLPVYPGEIQCKALGMAVDILDPVSPQPVSITKDGAAGELVCTQPFPSQPLRFVGEDGFMKYRASYFDRFGPAIWCQGDFVRQLKDTGGLIILGRSDGVLNPSGVRFGSAEIYAVTDRIPQLIDSICVGQKLETNADERVLLFVKMKPDTSLTPQLTKRIRDAIRKRYSPRHVPSLIFEVPDIPYTVNGKKCEIIVKRIVSGHKATVNGSIANPEALQFYERFAKLPVAGTSQVPCKVKL